MSERKIVVPEAMLQAAMDAQEIYAIPQTRHIVEAVLRWLSENPIVPTPDQWAAASDAVSVRYRKKFGVSFSFSHTEIAEEWQRRMFLAPEPSAPIELIDLLWQGKVVMPADESIKENDRRIIEAYRRGKESK